MQICQKFNISKKVVLTALFFIFTIGAFLFLSNLASAATDQFGMNFPAKLGLPNNDPRLVIMSLVRLALGFVGIIAVIIIMYAGFLWMTSAGNEQKVDDAKKTLVNAVIGLVIILSAFLIVSFIINKISGSLAGDPDDGGGGGRDRTAGGLAALGNCAIDSVYPEPYQREVPRNTSIIVTFREAVNPATIVDAGNNNIIRTNSILIYKSNDSPPVPLTAVTGTTTDNRTFIFTPADYLGSPSEYIWYSVKLTSDIRKQSDGQSVFAKCGLSQEFIWRFEVSNKIDLIPPQVAVNGLFPNPDNERDNISGAMAVAASGAINVLAQPRTYSAARVNSVTPQGGTPSGASATADAHCARSANNFTVTMLDDSYAGLSVGSANLGSAVFIGNSITFAGYFTLTAGGAVANGQQWTVDLTAETLADNINVDGFIYTFTSGVSQGSEIHADADNNATADNIAAALAGQARLRTVRTGARVDIIARMAGAAGNNIVLTSSNPSALAVTPLAGGVDSRQTVEIRDKKDQPRNAVVQVNFNEAINPITVSGDAAAVRDYIRVVNDQGAGAAGSACTANADCLSYSCLGDICQGDFLTGRFIVSNAYRTVEFISDNLCGVNSCGERIFCLPENSHLRVDITASPLAACNNCPAKAPFTDCTGGHCYNSANNQYHPLAVQPPLGLVDMAMNSLDGNRSGDAVGPVSYYNENAPADNDGDSYQWSFFINDNIDITTPVINSIEPVHGAIGVNLSDPIKINFSKIMMSSSLKTGSAEIDNGRTRVVHKSVNLWNYSNNPVGFWVASANIDNTNDGNADFTQAEIKHSIFADTTSYRAQAGSGVKDIYQNCFSPSAGNYGAGNCPADANNRSCCPSAANLNPANVPPGGNCPHN